MCGITGIFAPRSGFHTEWIPLLHRMNDTLVHRGPDADGFYIDAHVGLGHRRLSIIDLSTGQQPLTNEDSTVWVTFNGEIYNYKELARELEGRGHVFRTQSDTEAIVHAYEEWGEDCLAHLRGMFAFAIWDQRRRRLFLARDRLGKKPLYYAALADGTLIFASELKALLCFPGFDRSIDLEAFSDYLSLSYVPSPKTIYRGARKLPAGHYLVATADGHTVKRYWDVCFQTVSDEAQPAERLRELLHEAVSMRLRSDVPLGAFLSGGIDSSSIVAFMSGLSSTPVITSSVGFREEAFDELPLARSLAQHLGTEHHEETVTPDSIEVLARLAGHFDEPFADPSVVPTYFVAKVARQRVTVALSGDGGDESFAGYERYYHSLLEQRVRSTLPRAIRNPLFGLLGRLYPEGAPPPFRAKAFLGDVARAPWEAYFRLMSSVKPIDKPELLHADVRQALRGYDSANTFEQLYGEAGNVDLLSRLQYIDFKTYLSDGVLTKVDRTSMANSLEVRCPLLDHRVVEFAASLAPQLKMSGRQSKLVLRQAAAPLLPSDVTRRAKRGFNMPVAQWLRHGLEPIVRRVLLDSTALDGLLERRKVESFWQEHRSGRRNHASALWTLLVLGLWTEQLGRSGSQPH